MSIPLNIGEASGKVSPAERLHGHAIARGEAMECGTIIDVVRLIDVIPPDELNEGRQLLIRIVSMLSKMCR